MHGSSELLRLGEQLLLGKELLLLGDKLLLSHELLLLGHELLLLRNKLLLHGGGELLGRGGGGAEVGPVDHAQSLGGELGLDVDVRLGGDLLVDVGLGRDLHVLVGDDLGGGGGGGSQADEDLATRQQSARCVVYSVYSVVWPATAIHCDSLCSLEMSDHKTSVQN